MDSCPFCGSEHIFVNDDGSAFRWCECEDCGACGPRDISEDDAVFRWNQRAA
jgi:Lar family restriction alleviation protein